MIFFVYVYSFVYIVVTILSSCVVFEDQMSYLLNCPYCIMCLRTMFYVSSETVYIGLLYRKHALCNQDLTVVVFFYYKNQYTLLYRL